MITPDTLGGNDARHDPILIVDDHLPSIAMLEMMLKTASIDNIIPCHDSRQVAEVLASRNIAVALLDLRMPHVSGEELLALIMRDYKDLPVIVVTGNDDVETAVRCMKNGAFDYVVKPVDKSRLIASVKNALLVNSLVNENRSIREQARRQIMQLAYYDNVTGLPNRELIKYMLKQAVAQAERRRSELAVLCLDLDHFKRVNDLMGHYAGDCLLTEMAARLLDCVRNGDCVASSVDAGGDPSAVWDGSNAVARVGSDEFVILLNDLGDPAHAASVAERIRAALQAPFVIDDTPVCIATSIGISHYPSDGADASTLLKNADAAMHHVKKRGRNGYQYYISGLNEYARDRLALEHSLRLALERDEFVLQYQPRVNVADGQVIGAEALVRWQHPDDGMISPAQFIPVAEETGLIVALGHWVLQNACEQTKAWRLAGLPPLRVSVNLSPRQFRQKTLADEVATILQRTGAVPDELELELTESMLMDDGENTLQQLRELKALGVRLAIDDFGTGYSSLSYLKRFPIDVLKIDQSFVADIGKSSQDDAILDVIIAMGRNLNLTIIGEGVEKTSQMTFLRQRGCDEVQGYLLSRPLSDAQFIDFFRSAAA